MRAAWLAAALLAACGRADPDPAGARLIAAGPAARGFAVAPDASRAVWIEGAWPDRTRLALRDLRDGRVTRRRFKGYSLVEAAFDPAGSLKVLARKTGAPTHPGNPPKQAAILTLSRDGADMLETLEDPDGRIVDRRPAPWHQGTAPTGRYETAGPPDLLVRGPRRTVWAASMTRDGARFAVESFDEDTSKRLAVTATPGPVESLLVLEDAVYLLTRSSDSLPTAPAPGPRLLTKVDLATGRAAWSAPWADRAGALLARGPDGRLFVAVTDPAAPSLWEVEDRPQAVVAAAAAAAAPRAERDRGLRTAGWYLLRLLPALLIGVLYLLFRR